jgi:hypothetical protein
VYSKVTERKTAIDALLNSDLEYDTKLHQSSIRGVYWQENLGLVIAESTTILSY